MSHLVETPSGRLWLVDDVNYVRCPMCTEWFFRGTLTCGYCTMCWRHYYRWRQQELAREKANGYRIAVDVSVRTFREKYMEGLLQPLVPWTWTYPTGTEAPVGAVL